MGSPILPDTFSLRHPSELPGFFAFAEIDPITVPDWLVAVVYKDLQHQAPPGRPQRARYNRRGHGGPS